VESRALSVFPADDLGYGFDNCGAVLTTSPLLFEKLVAEAERIAAEAISAEDPAHPAARRVPRGIHAMRAQPALRDGKVQVALQ